MGNNHQLASAAAFAAEILRELPRAHENYPVLADLEATANISLGFTNQGLERYLELLGELTRRMIQEPDRADYQRDLSVSYERMGDLLRALGAGEQARDYYGKSLEIIERLAKQEPDRADYQRDLSVSYNKMGDLLRALGAGEQAREYYGKSLEIRELLAKQEPDRADYQTDLAASLYRIAIITSENSIPALERALAILRELDAAGRLEPAKKDWILTLEEEIRNREKKISPNIFQTFLAALSKPWHNLVKK